MMSKEELELIKKTKINRKRLERWLIKNQKFINITAIEKEVSAPKGLVQKFIKYDKKIHDKWVTPIHDVVKGFTSFSLK